MDCGVWRYHPQSKKFEAIAHGTTNPWGLDWDEHGEMFITNCVLKHIFHIVPGGHYVRMYGQDVNPHTYSLMESCADHIHWGGGAWTTSRNGKGEHSRAGGGHAHAGHAGIDEQVRRQPVVADPLVERADQVRPVRCHALRVHGRALGLE